MNTGQTSRDTFHETRNFMKLEQQQQQKKVIFRLAPRLPRLCIDKRHDDLLLPKLFLERNKTFSIYLRLDTTFWLRIPWCIFVHSWPGQLWPQFVPYDVNRCDLLRLYGHNPMGTGYTDRSCETSSRAGNGEKSGFSHILYVNSVHTFRAEHVAIFSSSSHPKK
jgi:hypothetical protein